MKIQALFSSKDKSKIKMSSAAVLFDALRVKKERIIILIMGIYQES